MLTDMDHLFTAPISELAPAAPISVTAGTSVGDAIALMQKHRIGCILVTQGGRLAGILTDRDVTMKVAGRPVEMSVPVEDLMTVDPETLSPDHEIAYALNRMSLGGYRHVPLVDGDGTPRGVISVKDVVNHIVEHFPQTVYNLPPEPDVISRSREGA